MPRYNIALLPEDAALAANLTGYAQAHFKHDAKGYLLGPKALPHVTLCQFEAQGDEQARKIFAAWQDKAPLNLQFSGFYTWPRIEKEGVVGLNVRLSPELQAMQSGLYNHIEEHGQTIFTGVRDYAPHITLARLPHPPKPDALTPDDLPFLSNKRYYPALGTCSDLGVFTEVLAQHRGKPAGLTK